MYAITISNLSSLFSSADSAHAQVHSRLQLLQWFARKHALPVGLVVRASRRRGDGALWQHC